MRRLAVLLAVLLATSARADGSSRHALAWPPTRYDSAELLIWRDAAGPSPLSVRVVARGLDATLDVPASAPLRVPLPLSARCAAGIDACGIEVLRAAGEGSFSVMLQSPDTNGAADTLLLTAHDTVLVPPADRAGSRHVALSMPCAPPPEMPLTASFVTVVPAADAARVTAPATACTGPVEATLAWPEALTLACDAEGDDLAGLLVDASAPVVALSGSTVTTVPVAPGLGYSGDLLLDLAGGDDGPALYAVPALPRAAALAGRGDLVLVAALEDAGVTVHDGLGGRRVLDLRAGEVARIDTAAPGADMPLLLESDASIAAWHVTKSRALRGIGDPAAIPLVPSTRFATAARFVVPDGYAEANVLCIAATPGARVTLDGGAVPLAPAPTGALDMAVVGMPAAPAGGAVHELLGDAPFGAWVVAFGGYKACGHAAAIGWPAPLPWLLRGTRPDDLRPFAPARGNGLRDAAPEPLVFWILEDGAPLLRVARCAGDCCLSW